jgi:hypothetical protein
MVPGLVMTTDRGFVEELSGFVEESSGFAEEVLWSGSIQCGMTQLD